MADNDQKIKRALKARINSNNDEFFHEGDKVFFKEKENLDKYKSDWSGPAKVIGNEGKVLFLKYGNMMRRIHKSKVTKENNEFKSVYTSSLEINPSTEHINENNINEPTQNGESISSDNVNENTEDNDKKSSNADSTTKTPDTSTNGEGCESLVENNSPSILPTIEEDSEKETTTVKKRSSPLRCPNVNRRIKFKKASGNIWYDGEVKKIFTGVDSNAMICQIIQKDDVVTEIDFSKGFYEWKYVDFKCDQCSK